jgi:hypothetical protein
MNAPAVSVYIVQLPIEFLRWWFLEAPVTIFRVLRWIFAAVAHLFSFKELFTTYFRPWKNEYREGLVRTGIFIGAFIKSWLIVFDIFILSIIFVLELAVLIFWLALPFIAIFAIYGAVFA